MRSLVSLVAGLVFGAGLVVSGMANPAKVMNFLDLAGTWDPSLAFVMGGAMLVTIAGYRFAFKRTAPLLDDCYYLPGAKSIDASLLSGSALFGIGWGLSGFCPGPAVVALSQAAPGTLAFFPAMMVGMLAARTLGPARPAKQAT